MGVLEFINSRMLENFQYVSGVKHKLRLLKKRLPNRPRGEPNYCGIIKELSFEDNTNRLMNLTIFEYNCT